MSVFDLLTLDRIIGLSGIFATLIIAIAIYKIQRKEQRETTRIIKKMDSILAKLAEISESEDKRRRNTITWFTTHIGGLLKSLKEDFEELSAEVDNYKDYRSNENLRKIVASATSTRDITLTQLFMLAERDIPIAKDYLSNPWIVGKFLDAISVLTSPLNVKELEFEVMNDYELEEYRTDLQQHYITKIQSYIDIVQEEEMQLSQNMKANELVITDH